MTLISSHRMYDVNARVAALWQALYDRISEMSGVPLEPFVLEPPAPISQLWARPDMGLVQMCGWPYWRADPRPVALAAPVPLGGIANGAPVYWTDMVVRADAPFRTLEDTFGHRLAWTIPGSHSGYNAPRRLLADAYAARGGPLFAETVGPVITPRGAIEAVLEDRADIAPVDGFYFLLLQKHDPGLAARVRVVARTQTAPIPLLVASNGIAPDIAGALTDALLAAHRDDRCAPLLDALCIRRYVAVEREAYRLGDDWAAHAASAGYSELA